MSADSTGIKHWDRATWDTEVTTLGGHFLQSWRWGEFKQRHGWSVERIVAEAAGERAMAQILYRNRGPLTVGYIPRGPVVKVSAQSALAPLLTGVDATCRLRRSLWLMVEANEQIAWHGDPSFNQGMAHFQPGCTVKVPLVPEEEQLLLMHSKTRYSVRLAGRRGVSVKRVESDDTGQIRAFYQLLQDTAVRQSFGIHTLEYYLDFMATFRSDALLLHATIGANLAAGLIAVRFGTEAIYMYGASSTEFRAHGAAFLLQFEAMKWAQSSGQSVYDLWGIPGQPITHNSDPSDEISKGLLRFKMGFGGQVVAYPPTLERRYHPMLTRIAREMTSERS